MIRAWGTHARLKRQTETEDMLPNQSRRSPRRRRVALRTLSLLGAMVFAPRPVVAQVQVVDSVGAGVPYAILESPSGLRLVADASGTVRQARPGDGPWLARRIGYRPARGADGADRIVLVRLPQLLPAFRVAQSATCSASEVAARSPGDAVSAVRTLFAEHHERRELAGRERAGITFEIDVTLESEDGVRMEVDRETVTMPVAPADRPYVPGRAIERVDGEWVLRRPGLRDLTTDAFLETHCLSIEGSDTDSLAVVRFAPREDLTGAQLLGRYVVDRRSGRLHSDTLDYLRPPKGAPGRARLVGSYGLGDAGADLLAVPDRIVESVSPADMRVSLNGRRVRIVRTERTLTRVAGTSAPTRP
jgi:hypothetical protein